MLIKQQDGTEIEVFTIDEVEAKSNEVLDTYKKESEGKLQTMSTEIETLKKQIEDAENGGGDDKDVNIRNLRDALKKKDTEFSEFKSSVETQISEIRLGSVNELKTELLDKLSGKNPELKKKIEFFFDEFKGETKSRKDVIERIKNAYTLATGTLPKPGIFDGGIGSGAGGPGGGPAPEAQDGETDNQKAMRNVLGISDADAKKYGDKINNRNK